MIDDAIKDLKATIQALDWVGGVFEVERDPSGSCSVYLLPESAEVRRNISQIKGHNYALTVRIAITGKDATASNIFMQQQALEDAVEYDQRRGGAAQTTWVDEQWTEVETKTGFIAFENTINIQIQK